MGSRRRIVNRKSVPYLMTPPSTAMIALSMFYPIFMTFFNSFRNYILTQPKNCRFNGLNNYVKLFEDPVSFKALKDTVVWAIWNVMLQAGFGLMVAILMNTDFKECKLYRMVVSSPWAFGGTIVALVFSYMFTGQTGAINDILMRAGIIRDRIPWFAIGTRAMGMLIFIATWRGIPSFVVSLLAALQFTPHNYYGTADVGGVGVIYQFLHIVMPPIRNAVVLATMLCITWTFNIVDTIVGMTTGGSNNAIMTLSMHLMSRLNEGMDIEYSSCMAIVIALILAIFAVGHSLVGGFGKEGDL